MIYVEKPQPKPKQPKPQPRRRVEPPPEPEPEFEPAHPRPAIGWAWFEREPADGKISTEERTASTLNAAHRAINREWEDEVDVPEDIPEDVWNRNDAWWDGSRVNT